MLAQINHITFPGKRDTRYCVLFLPGKHEVTAQNQVTCTDKFIQNVRVCLTCIMRFL